MHDGRFLLQVFVEWAQHGPKESPMRIDIYDEVGIGGGASGVSGGLLHPYSPKGLHEIDDDACLNF